MDPPDMDPPHTAPKGHRMMHDHHATSHPASAPLDPHIEISGQGDHADARPTSEREYQGVDVDTAKSDRTDGDAGDDADKVHLDGPKYGYAYTRSNSSSTPDTAHAPALHLLPAAHDSIAGPDCTFGARAQEQQYDALPWYSRERYFGALFLNRGAAFIPALYGTLSIMWVGGLGGAGSVATAVSYTYAGVVVECFNEGLPRAVWSTTTNRTSLSLIQRHTQIRTLITIQSLLGLCILIAFLASARAFVGAFVPQGTDVEMSVKYVRLSSGSLAVGMINGAVGLGTRALDHPDVPLIISTVTTLLQIFLELALISTVRVRSASYQPTVVTQAIIRLVCDIAGCITGITCFLLILRRAKRKLDLSKTHPATVQHDGRWGGWFEWTAFKHLFKPGKWTFLESAVRNAIYLYLVSNVVSMGTTYATAWGLFNTIRWGLIMVPVTALEATSNAHTGHRWHRIASFSMPNAGRAPVVGSGRQQGEECAVPGRQKRTSWKDIGYMVTPAFGSAGLALLFEVPICIALSLGGARGFAWYLVTGGVGADEGAEGAGDVADITAYMWRTVDWMYICYAISTCLATILLATRAELYLLQSLVSNLCYCLPWAVVIGVNAPRITPGDAWWWHQWVFLVFSLVDIILFVLFWTWLVRTGRMARWANIGARLKRVVRKV